jgi:hypothetical protein
MNDPPIITYATHLAINGQNTTAINLRPFYEPKLKYFLNVRSEYRQTLHLRHLPSERLATR